MSAKSEEIETRVEPAGNRWLVSTAATKTLLHYDTATELTLPNQTVFLRVPQGAMHTVAAAQYFPFLCFVWLFVYMLFFVLCTSCWVNNISRHDLLKKGVCYGRSVTAEFLRSHNIPVDIPRNPTLHGLSSLQGGDKGGAVREGRSEAAGPAH